MKQCFILTSALCSNLSHLRELDLSGNKIKNRGVQILCDVLNNLRCKLERLRSVTKKMLKIISTLQFNKRVLLISHNESGFTLYLCKIIPGVFYELMKAGSVINT